MVAPVVRRVDRHGDEPPPAADRAADQNAPRRLCVTGLDPVRAVIAPEELIVVAEAAAGDARCLCRGNAGKRGLLHGIGRKISQIPGGGVVPVVVQAVGVGKVRISQAQGRRAAIHLRHEGGDRAAAVQRQRHGGVVAGLQQQTVEQLLHRQHLAGLQIQRRPFHAAGSGGNRHRFVQRAALCDEQACHNLRRAGNQAPRPGVLFIEDAPGGAVQQNSAAGRKLRRRLRSAGQQRRKADKCQRRGYHASQFAR